MNVLIVLGAIVASAGALAVTAALVLWAVQMVHVVIERIEARGEARTWDRLKNKLRAASWWFSEDPPTRELLADLAELNEWEAREKWRKARSGFAYRGKVRTA